MNLPSVDSHSNLEEIPMLSPAFAAVTNPPSPTTYMIVRGILRDLSRTTTLDVPTLTGFIENTRAGEPRKVPFSLSGDNLSFFENYAPRWITEGEAVEFYGVPGDIFRIVGPDQISLSLTRRPEEPRCLDRILSGIPTLLRRFGPRNA